MSTHSGAVALPTARWGVANPRRALLVHGLSSNRAGWWRVGDALAAAGFEAVAPDLRGHGEAPSTTSYRLEEMAGDLTLLGEEWDVVVGHSLGGAVAAMLLHLGVRADGVVLIDPLFEIGDDEFDQVVAEQVEESDPFAHPDSIAREHPRWHPNDTFHKARAARAISASTVRQILWDNAPWKHADLLVGMGAACTILGADPARSALFSPQLAERVAALEPDLTYVPVSGVGHSIHREDPDVVVAAVTGGTGPFGP